MTATSHFFSVWTFVVTIIHCFFLNLTDYLWRIDFFSINLYKAVSLNWFHGFSKYQASAFYFKQILRGLQVLVHQRL